MHKYRYLAMAAGVAMVLSVPAGIAVAANVHAAPKAVLTISKVNGTPVKKGAVLKASLAKGQKVTLGIGTSVTDTCASSSIVAKVVKNPAKAGEATLSTTGVSVSKCGVIDGLTISLTAINTPYTTTVKSSKGDPVTLSETSKSKPMGFKVAVTSGKTPVATCIFTAASASGHGSNKGNTVTFTKQPFTLNKTLTGADYSLCSTLGTGSKFTATYGPIVDSSVKHSPKVFIS